jgi:hypothetical protein
MNTAKALDQKLETNVEAYQPDYSDIYKNKRKKTRRK